MKKIYNKKPKFFRLPKWSKYDVSCCLFAIGLFQKVSKDISFEPLVSGYNAGFEMAALVRQASEVIQYKPAWFYRHSIHVDGQPFLKMDSRNELQKFGYVKLLWWLVVFHK